MLFSNLNERNVQHLKSLFEALQILVTYFKYKFIHFCITLLVHKIWGFVKYKHIKITNNVYLKKITSYLCVLNIHIILNTTLTSVSVTEVRRPRASSYSWSIWHHSLSHHSYPQICLALYRTKHLFISINTPPWLVYKV